jgi:hypothetical protein
MRPSPWLSTVAASALIAALIGCGGTTNSTPTGGGTGGAPLPTEQGTARVDVNTETGAVKVTPLGKGNQTNSLYTGSALSIASTSLSTDPGELTLKKLKLTIANNTTDAIEGGRMIFDTVSSDVGGSLDLRAFSSVATIVGPGSSPNDGPGSSVTISQPTGMARDTDGSIFIAGSGDGTLRRLKNDFVTRIATGIATPGGIALSGASVFMVEQSAHNLVRVPTTGGSKFLMAGGSAAGYVDGSGATARFSSPRDIEIIGSTAYIADLANDKIRTAINLSGGSATVATLNVFPAITSPSGLAYLPLGGIDWLVVTSSNTHKVFLVNSANGQSFQIAGTGTTGLTNGLGTVAQFDSPFDATVSGGAIFVADLGNRLIRQLTLNDGALPQFPSSWTVKTVAGSGTNGAVDGPGGSAQFGSPRFMETDGSGGLLLGDLTNNRVRRITAASGVFPITGTGSGTGQVELIGVDGYVPDPGTLDQRKPFLELAPFAPKGEVGDSQQHDINFTVASSVKSFYFIISISGDSPGTPAALDSVSYPTESGAHNGSPNVAVRTIAGNGSADWVDGVAAAARFGAQCGVARSRIGYFIADVTNATIRYMDFQGNVTTVAGIRGVTGGNALPGTGATCSFANPFGIWSNEDGNLLYVTDFSRSVVMRLALVSGSPADPNNWLVSIIAGSNGATGNIVGDGVTARFFGPVGVAAEPNGRRIFVTDYNNQCVKVLDFNGADPTNPSQWTVSFFVGSTIGASGYANGTGTASLFTGPFGLAFSKSGDLYITENGGRRIRRVNAVRDVTLVAGDDSTGVGTMGNADGIGNAARFTDPRDITLDDAGYAYVADASVIRRISLLTREARTVAGRLDLVLPRDGSGATAVFKEAYGIDYDPQRGLIVGDTARIALVERIIRTGQP